jgi:beta-1,4-mannosyl-glycoprotein beta-1,4-N-acetylglucosaminyltransferase
MRIIDCFIFYNELDLLKYRIDVYSEVVDYFVIVESKYTFSGFEKELYYENNKNDEIFERNKDKIIHIILDQLPYIYPNIDYNKKHQWINEEYQRNSILLGIDKINNILIDKSNNSLNIDTLNNDDLIIINDVDEFTDYFLLQELKRETVLLDTNIVNVLKQDMYYYNLNTFNGDWYHSKLLSYKLLKYLINNGKTVNSIRIEKQKINYRIIERAGWHLSYFGDMYYIRNKLRNFSHQEFNIEKYTNIKTIKDKIQGQTNLFDNKKLKNIPLSQNTYLPYKYEIYLQKYI